MEEPPTNEYLAKAKEYDKVIILLQTVTSASSAGGGVCAFYLNEKLEEIQTRQTSVIGDSELELITFGNPISLTTQEMNDYKDIGAYGLGVMTAIALAFLGIKTINIAYKLKNEALAKYNESEKKMKHFRR